MLHVLRSFIIFYFFAFIPIVNGADTNCKMVEFEDHVELVCTGNEKSEPVTAPAPVQNPAAVQAPVVPQSVVPKKAEVAAPAITPAKTILNQGTVVHRQGRQQHQEALKDAKESRMKLIEEQERNKPYQAPIQAESPPVIEE